QRSQEYGARVVQGLYRQLLQRDADPVGLAAWVRLLTQGGTAEQLQAILLGSDEYFARHGGTTAGFLHALYQEVLARDIDEAGQRGWGRFRAGGTRGSAVAAAVRGSREADSQAVQSLYRLYLRRPADSAGHQAWVEALQRGMSQEQLVVALLG